MADEEFNTNAHLIRVSKEMYGDMAARPIGNLVFPRVGAKKTPAQQREEEVRVAKAKQAAADRITQARIKHGIVIAHYAENTPVLEVLALHQPVQGDGYWESTVCAGCDYAGYEAEPTEYPCRTTMVLTVLAGIEFA